MNDQFDDATEGEQSLRSGLSRTLSGLREADGGEEPFVLADPDGGRLHVIGIGPDGRPRHVGTADDGSTGGESADRPTAEPARTDRGPAESGGA